MRARRLSPIGRHAAMLLPCEMLSGLARCCPAGRAVRRRSDAVCDPSSSTHGHFVFRDGDAVPRYMAFMIDWIFRSQCAACGAPAETLCSACNASLEELGPACPGCAEPTGE